jgi:hypothetical protein
MKGKETDPPARVNGILMGVIPRLGHVIGDVMNRDHPVGEGQDDEDEDGECKIAQKVHRSRLLSVKGKEFFPASLSDWLNSHTQGQCLLDFSRTKKASIKFALLCSTTHAMPLAIESSVSPGTSKHERATALRGTLKQ